MGSDFSEFLPVGAGDGTLGGAASGGEADRGRWGVQGIVDWYAGDVVSTPPEYARHFSESLLLLPLPYLANSLPVAAKGRHAAHDTSPLLPRQTSATAEAPRAPVSRAVLFENQVCP